MNGQGPTGDLAAWLQAEIEELSREVEDASRHPDNVKVCAYLASNLDALRRLVEVHQPGGQTSLGDDDDPESWRKYCKTCGSGEPYEYPVWWPCETLKLLALPCADRPGYRDEWRP